MWNKGAFIKRDQWLGTFSTSILLEEASSNSSWIVTSVYRPNDSSLRDHFWRELDYICDRWSNPWCISGDWNVVRFPNERSGCITLTSEMTSFSDWINQHVLVDLQMGGAQFT